MGASRSSEETWAAGARVFSGRPDPTWSVSRKLAARLEGIWESLETYEGSVPHGPRLGYRGCFLRRPAEREWIAYGGVVSFTAAGTWQSRRDSERSFERVLLASAPKGLLPDHLFD